MELKERTTAFYLSKATWLTLARSVIVATAAILVSGCGTITDVRALIHERVLYLANPRFSGPAGPLTRQQGQEIIAKLQAHQKTPSNILERQLAFAQAISDVPLTTGNKVTLLKNSGETYPAMLAAIRGATNNINMEMYIFSDGPIGDIARALNDRQRHGVQVNVSYDSLGSFSTSAAFFDRLRKAGVAVLQYRPVNPFAAPLIGSLAIATIARC